MVVVEASFFGQSGVGVRLEMCENVEVEAESRRASGWGGPLHPSSPEQDTGSGVVVCMQRGESRFSAGQGRRLNRQVMSSCK